MTRVSVRAFTPLNLSEYNRANRPDEVGKNDLLTLPKNDYYILRMLIKEPHGEYRLPKDLEWVRPLILQAHFYQQNEVGVNHPYCYLTIRKGEVKSVTDDEWHVDGFSTGITHLPEQNYIWTDVNPTEYVVGAIKFPDDFNPRKHNIQYYFQDYLSELENHKILSLKPETMYCLDPYVIHRRPQIKEGTNRTFIRISFCPIEINDVNNTENPRIRTHYWRDGVKDFRNKLIRYPVKSPTSAIGMSSIRNIDLQ